MNGGVRPHKPPQRTLREWAVLPPERIDRRVGEGGSIEALDSFEEAHLKGRCVICDAAGPLTRDHVPPQAVVAPSVLEVQTLTALLGDASVPGSPRGGFRAPTFPSICKNCNTDRLGREYDPSLERMAVDVRRWMTLPAELGIELVGNIEIETRPYRLARAVVGHLLAAEERRDPSKLPPRGTLTEALRSFFLDIDAPWPQGIHFYLWPYPGKEQVIIRGFGISRVIGQTYGPIIGDILKFFPVAFWITADPAVGVPYSLTPLPFPSVISLDSSVEITIPVRNQPRRDWPETPGDDEVLALNDQRSSIASPKPKQRAGRRARGGRP